MGKLKKIKDKFFNKHGKPVDERGEATTKRDDKCIPVSFQIIEMLYKYKADINSGTSPEEGRKMYDGLAKDVLQLLLDKDTKVNDTAFIFSTIHSVIDIVKDIVEQSLTVHMEQAEKNLWGKDPAEITMSNLELVMRLDRSQLKPNIKGADVKKV